MFKRLLNSEDFSEFATLRSIVCFVFCFVWGACVSGGESSMSCDLLFIKYWSIDWLRVMMTAEGRLPFPELSPVDDRSLRGNTLSRRVSECASRVSTGATSVGRESSTLFSRRVSRHSDDDVDIDERSARALTEFLRSTEIRSPSRRRRR